MLKTVYLNTCCALALTLFAGPVLAAPQAGTEAAVKAPPAMAQDVSLPPATAAGHRLIGDLETITTDYEDTLVHLARKYNVGFVEMRAANPGIDPWMPGDGTKITVPTQHILPDAPHQGVVINLPEMRMYFYFDPKEPPATYPIGIGRTGLTTPLGSTTIARMSIDPIWRPTDRMRAEDPTLPAVVPPGPENPMGTHAMYLGWPSYAIHGTDKPYSIGRRLSSGCIRMYPEDIITLFDNVDPGTQVTVVDQPVKTAWVDGRYYVQVHPTQEQSDMLSHDGTNKPSYPLRDDDIKTILKGVEGQADVNVDWTKLKAAVKERRGIPIVVATQKGAKPADTAVEKASAPVAPKTEKVEKAAAAEKADQKVDKVEKKTSKPAAEKPATKKTTAEKPASSKATSTKDTKKANAKGETSSSSKKPKDGIVPAHGVMKKAE